MGVWPQILTIPLPSGRPCTRGAAGGGSGEREGLAKQDKGSVQKAQGKRPPHWRGGAGWVGGTLTILSEPLPRGTRRAD